MTNRKPRYDNIQRVLNRMRNTHEISDTTIRRYASEHNICPDHLHYLPCAKCNN